MDDRRRVARALEELALFSELFGENPFKVRALANAARAVQRHPGDLAALAARGELTAIRGIGKGIASIIEEALTGHEPAALTELRGRAPEGLADLLALPGLGPRRVRALWQELGVTTLGELEYACRENRLVALSGLGATTQAKLAKAIEFRRRAQGLQHLSVGIEVAEATAEALRRAFPASRIAVAGEVRRACEVISEVALVCSGPPPEAVVTVLATVAGGVTLAEAELRGRHALGLPVKVVAVPGDDFGVALIAQTGSREHVAELTERAAAAHLSLAGMSLRDAAGRPVHCPEEADLYRRLGLALVPPELREGRGELEAAATSALPALVGDGDILGVVHAHTTDSDGSATLEEMAAAAAARGWSYLGIADHSAAARYANGLDEARLRAQGEAIVNRNGRGEQPLLLRGLEADIMPDGTLDRPRNVELDFVVASVHSSFTLAAEEQTARLRRAVSQGSQVILGHPTGRLLLAREGYEVDLEAVLQAAAASGAAVEINAHPFRLDLDWRWVRRAVELGVPLSIGPDAHDAEGLGVVKYGVAIARKGWATAADILNARPWPWW